MNANTHLKWASVSVTGKLALFGKHGKDRLRSLLETQEARLTEHVTRKTTHLVVGMLGWPLLRDGKLSQKLQQAERFRKRGYKIQIVSERQLHAWLFAGETDGTRKTLARVQVLELTGARDSDLRLWERLGLVQAHEDYFDFQDVVSLKSILELVGEDVSLDAIAGSMATLSQSMPGIERPLSQLELIKANQTELLTRLDGQLQQATGQYVFDYDGSPEALLDEQEQSPVAANITSDEQLFAQALKLESEESYEAAASVYERILAREEDSEAAYNLGNIYRALHDLTAAEKAYRKALDWDPYFAEAWYNLADVQEEAGDIKAAMTSLHEALKLDPMYGDAHFNLALLLQENGESMKANRHWQKYLRISPFGEWAEIARSHLAAD